MLAPPGRLSLDTRVRALRLYTLEVPVGRTRVYVLNRTATALHLAIHILEGLKLRDLFLLAEQLAQMSADERHALRSIVDTERLEPIRLPAVVYAAARAAGLQWPATTSVRRYARWMLQRGDLPRPLRVRPVCVDAWLGSDARRFRAAVGAAFRCGGGLAAASVSAPRRYLRPFARLLCGLVIACYRSFMKKSEADELLEDAIDVTGHDRPIDAGTASKLVDDRADGARSVAQP
jgi:hypothetical protein